MTAARIRRISRDDEALMRRAFEALDGGTVHGCELRLALQALAPRRLGLSATDRLIERANRAGMLLLAGTWMQEACRLHEGWQCPPQRAANARGARRLTALRALWQARPGIAIRDLSPSVGTVCGALPAPDPEVIPAHIADGIDAMHRSAVRYE